MSCVVVTLLECTLQGVSVAAGTLLRLDLVLEGTARVAHVDNKLFVVSLLQGAPQVADSPVLHSAIIKAVQLQHKAVSLLLLGV